VELTLDDLDDTVFWQRWAGLDCTPLYSGRFSTGFPTESPR
jgi:hypothetical protein